MASLFFVLLLAGCALWGWYLFGFRLRRRWRANVTGRNLAPHQRWPEILHWERGDEFDVSVFSDYHSIHLISLTEDGGAYCNVNFGHKAYLSIGSLVGHNVSLRDRNLTARINRPNEYTDLIEEFNSAYAELESRDRKNGISLK